MATLSTRWWGIIVSLNHEEGCFAATGSPAGEALLNAIPPPWGQIVLIVIKIHKAWIGANIGGDGVDLHFNWGGFLHYVGRRGDPEPCTGLGVGSRLGGKTVSAGRQVDAPRVWSRGR
jgi:hypothetical protein